MTDCTCVEYVMINDVKLQDRMSEIPDYNGRVSKIDYKSTSIQP